MIIFGFLAMVIFNGLYPQMRIFPMFMDPRYPIYYTLYQLLYIAIIISFHNTSGFPYALLALTITNLIVLAVWRPYPENIHNITIVLEQVTILVALGVYMY